MKREHLLIIRFSALGDVAMMVPVVHALATQYPHLRITVLSRPFARTLFADLAPNVNFMAADLKREYHGVKGLNALYRRLAAKQFTKIADMHSVLRSDYLRLRFNLGHYRVEHISKHRSERRALIAQKNKRLVQLPTAFECYTDVLARLGYPVSLQFRSLFPLPPGENHADTTCRTGNDYGGNLNLLPACVGPKKSFEQWIGVAPTAAHPGKVYPPRLMEQVLQQLAVRYPRARFFLFGRGDNEQQLFSQWSAALPQCLWVSRELENMQQELILMSHLDVMISMDSANMHLASLTATPVVSIWGATHPFAGFLGWNQPVENVIQDEQLNCRPCSIYGQRPCQRGDYACLNQITPERIVRRVTEIINT